MATRDWGKLVEEGLDRVELRAKEKIRNGIDAVDRAFSGEAADDERRGRPRTTTRPRASRLT
jgi:hypothetical protein